MILARIILAICISLPPIGYFVWEDFFRDKETKKFRPASKFLLAFWIASALIYFYSEYYDISNLKRLQRNTENLTLHNEALNMEKEQLINEKDNLISQNELYKSEIRKYQIESSGLKNTLKQTIQRTFRVTNRSLEAQFNFALKAYQDSDVL